MLYHIDLIWSTTFDKRRTNDSNVGWTKTNCDTDTMYLFYYAPMCDQLDVSLITSLILTVFAVKLAIIYGPCQPHDFSNCWGISVAISSPTPKVGGDGPPQSP